MQSSRRIRSPLVTKALKLGGVHVVDNHRVIEYHHIIPVSGVDSCEVAPLDALKVVTDLRAGKRGLAGLDAGVGLLDVAALVERSVSVFLAAQTLDHLVSDLGELAAVHVMLAVHRVGRALMLGVKGEVEVDGVLGLGHRSEPLSFILTTV